MKYPVLIISINGEELTHADVYNFRIETDIYSNLPKGSFILRDQGGIHLAKFNIKIGATVTILIIEGDNEASSSSNNNSLQSTISAAVPSILGDIGKKDDKMITYTPFVITDLFEDVKNTEALDGELYINFAHPWSIYTDFTNHAYPGMQVSELIRKVVEESQRGFNMAVDVKNYEDSSDSGSQPRYKICESDYEFITNKLLPYAQINDAAAYFFIDDIGVSYLQSFKTMFDKEPVANLVLTGEPEEEHEQLPTIVINSCSIDIAKEPTQSLSILSKVKTKIYIEDLFARKFISGNKLPVTACDLNKGSFFPIDFMLMHMINATSSHNFINRSFEDQFALSSTWQRDLDGMFKLNIYCSFAGCDVNVGDTINFISGPMVYPNNENSQNPIEHDRWLNGKWLVSRIIHNKDTNVDQTNSILTIIRPTFIITPKTTIVNKELLYQVM